MNAGQRTLLVVDDSLTIRRVIELWIGKDGWRLVFAGTGGEAIDLVLRGGVDAILLDYLLPDRTAEEVLCALERTAAGARIPVLVVTAKRDAVRQALLAHPQVVDVLGKPFTREHLRQGLAGIGRPPTAEVAPPLVPAPAAPRPAAEAAAAPPTAAFSCRLDGVPPLGILARSFAGSSGRLRIERAGDAWDLWWNGTGLAVAGADAVAGIAAAAAATAPGGGTATWHPGPPPAAAARFFPPWAVAMAHARASADPMRAMAALPSLEVVPRRRLRLGRDEAELLDPVERRVWCAIDGMTALAGVAERAAQPSFTICLAVARLADAGLVSIDPPAHPAMRSVVLVDGDVEFLHRPLARLLAGRARPLRLVGREQGDAREISALLQEVEPIAALINPVACPEVEQVLAACREDPVLSGMRIAIVHDVPAGEAARRSAGALHLDKPFTIDAAEPLLAADA